MQVKCAAKAALTLLLPFIYLQDMYITMATRMKHPPDFKVSYCFYDIEKGCRQGPPRQGYRSDFWYGDADHKDSDQVFMIWPEFEDLNGQLIEDNSITLPASGTANMWIISPAMRSYHKEKIKVGLPGFFMEGTIRVAECGVVEIIGLMINPRVPVHLNKKYYS